MLRIPRPRALASSTIHLCAAAVDARLREPAGARRGRAGGRAAAAWKRAEPWSEIERLALEIAAREPLLRRLLVDSVLSQDTPAGIVGALLSRRLCRVHGATLRALVVETLEHDRALLQSLEADLAAVTTRDPACRSCLHALLDLKGLHALQAHRVAHSLWQRGRLDAAQWLSGQAALAFGVDIHPAVPIGNGVLLDHATGIVIGETAVVEDDVSIFHGVTLGATGNQSGDRHPKVRRGALLGAGATILGNIEVGCMSRVGAGSVVVAAVPPYCTVAGVPATVVRRPCAAAA